MAIRPALCLFLCLTAPLAAEPAAEAQPASATAESAAAGPVGPWKKSLISSLNVSQAYFDNWRAGGENSLAWAVNLSGGLDFDTADSAWNSKLRLDYGQARLGQDEPRKSADAIHADSSYTRKLNQWVNPYLSAAWDTQFTNGYQYFAGTTLTPVVVSKFMDPGTLTESLGLGYAHAEDFKVKLGAAAKQTFTDAYPAYADDPSTPAVERFKSELGASGQAELTLTLGQGLQFSSVLDVFSNLAAMDQVDVQWRNQLAAKVNSWLSCNVNVDLAYDRDISSQRQLKQGLSLNLSYNLL